VDNTNAVARERSKKMEEEMHKLREEFDQKMEETKTHYSPHLDKDTK